MVMRQSIFASKRTSVEQEIYLQIVGSAGGFPSAGYSDPMTWLLLPFSMRIIEALTRAGRKP
jgi:hypothetical protein